MIEKGEIDSVDAIRKHRRSLALAIQNKRSKKWLLRLWGRFIRARDLHRCLCCESNDEIQAHHVIRRTLCPDGIFELGNGITLCGECHRRVHAQFNRRPDLSRPIGAEQGDDQDEWAFLFGLLEEDANRRGLNEDEFYYLSDDMLRSFVRLQGYEEFYGLVVRQEMSRIKCAHEIWRLMPEIWYTNLVGELIESNLSTM